MPKRTFSLAAPFLRRIRMDMERVPEDARDDYPFGLPLFGERFDLTFDTAVMIVVGENGVGKSTLLEAIAALAGFDDAGGGPGYRPMDHANAIEASGGTLAKALRATWLPKMSRGWFFRAESFFSVARYLDQAALSVGAPPPDFLSHSHGEGFLRFFDERCRYRGLYILDEPESALSPQRQLAFLRLLARMDASGQAQVILSTHAPMLMAYPGATLLALTDRGIERVAVEDTGHYKLMRGFARDPARFVARVLSGEVESADGLDEE